MFKMINHKHYKTPTYNYNRQLYVLFPYGPVAFNDGFAVSQWKHEVWNQLRGWWLINVEMIIWALNINSFILTKHKQLDQTDLVQFRLLSIIVLFKYQIKHC